MPWNATYYPSAMKNLPLPVRAKAIDIANALLAQGYGEGKAIRIGVAKAREWAFRHKAALIDRDDAFPGFEDEV